MNHCGGESRVEASRETFPADDQSVGFAWGFSRRPLGLKRGDSLVDGEPTGLLGLPLKSVQLRLFRPSCPPEEGQSPMAWNVS
jgi:hypothetical protein